MSQETKKRSFFIAIAAYIFGIFSGVFGNGISNGEWPKVFQSYNIDQFEDLILNNIWIDTLYKDEWTFDEGAYFYSPNYGECSFKIEYSEKRNITIVLTDKDMKIFKFVVKKYNSNSFILTDDSIFLRGEKNHNFPIN